MKRYSGSEMLEFMLERVDCQRLLFDASVLRPQDWVCGKKTEFVPANNKKAFNRTLNDTIDKFDCYILRSGVSFYYKSEGSIPPVKIWEYQRDDSVHDLLQEQYPKFFPHQRTLAEIALVENASNRPLTLLTHNATLFKTVNALFELYKENTGHIYAHDIAPNPFLIERNH